MPSVRVFEHFQFENVEGNSRFIEFYRFGNFHIWVTIYRAYFSGFSLFMHITLIMMSIKAKEGLCTDFAGKKIKQKRLQNPFVVFYIIFEMKAGFSVFIN